MWRKTRKPREFASAQKANSHREPLAGRCFALIGPGSKARLRKPAAMRQGVFRPAPSV